MHRCFGTCCIDGATASFTGPHGLYGMHTLAHARQGCRPASHLRGRHVWQLCERAPQRVAHQVGVGVGTLAGSLGGHLEVLVAARAGGSGH